MSLNFWPFKKRVIEVQVIARDPLKLRLNEFQSNKALVGMANKVLLSPELRTMLDCVQNEHPGFWVLPQGATKLDRVRAQCLAEGYTMCLANLEAMGKFVELKQMPDPTFEPEEKQQQ